MFKLRANVAPHQARFEQAVQRLPRAHHDAQHVAITQLHHHVAGAVTDAGLDSSPLGVSWHKGVASLGIDHSEAGDALADVEYGTPDEMANPVIRTAARAAHPAANAVYNHVLYRGLGL